jgi:signal transduction histidine kinase
MVHKPLRRNAARGVEPARQALSDLLATVVNSLPIVVFALAADGTVLLAEGQGLEPMGSEPGGAVGRSVFDVFAGETAALDHLKRALAGDQHQAYVRLERNSRHYQLRYAPTFAADGRLTGVIGWSIDVTDQDAAERDLRQATRWLQDMLENLPVAIYTVDAGGILTLARGSILPETTQSWVGRPLAEGYDHFPQLLQAVEAALAGKDQAFSASGGGRHFEFLVNSMEDESGTAGVLGVVIEVTEQRKAAAAMLESEEKSRFLATVTHELRTPLNTILGFAELLEQISQGDEDPRRQRMVSNIRLSGEHLRQIIDQLLDMSRAESRRPLLTAETLEPGLIAEEIVERMSAVAATRGISLRTGHQAPVELQADRLALRQVLLNLASNAIKFTGSGGEVMISSYAHQNGVLFRVRDTGIGISPEDQERIFEEFFQVPTQDPTTARGSGLGLALSRKLARAMGGDLTVHSALRRGSTFQLRLPSSPLPG